MAFVAAIVASVFILPMIAGDPTKFFEQNFNTADAQLGVTPTNLGWLFHHIGFDPTVNQHLEVIPGALRMVSHPLAVALVLGLSILYWRRSVGRDPYDALQLLALLFLIRCVLDPLDDQLLPRSISAAIAMFEGLSCRRIPIVTLTSTAAILVLGDFDFAARQTGSDVWGLSPLGPFHDHLPHRGLLWKGRASHSPRRGS